MQKQAFTVTTMSPSATGTYDPAKAIAYAKQYYSDYNPDYPDWDLYGGDCANFISQCLFAGGKKMIGSRGIGNAMNLSNWFSYGSVPSSSSVSATWRGANAFKAFWMKHAKEFQSFPSYTEALYDYVSLGDAISLLNSNKVGIHTLLAIEKDTVGKDVILAAHTASTINARLTNKIELFGGGCIVYKM